MRLNFNHSFYKKRTRLRNSATFLERLSVLLQEGYTFYDAIYLLLPHHLKEYTETLIEVENSFKNGLSATEILSLLGYSKSVLLPVVIAEKEGALGNSLSVLAKRLEKTEEAKRKVKSLLAYPSVLFIFITALLISFRNFFLPNLETLVHSRPNTGSNIITILPTLVAKMPDLILTLVLSVFLAIVGSLLVYRRLSAAKKITFFMSMPLIKNLFLMVKTRSFTNEIGGLLEAGFSLQDGLDILIEQELDVVLQEISRNVKEQVKYGEPFHMAVGMTDGLTQQLTAFVKHGESSGHLPKELLVYSNHLDDEINRKIEKGLSLLQPLLFSLVAVCILAAYLALLLPVYGMLDHF